MQRALTEARAAAHRGEVPVGAVLISPQGDMIAAAGNRNRELNDPTAHAEILVIREGCRQQSTDRLNGYDLYVTLEPCAMCAAAIAIARIARLYFGAEDPKSGGVVHGVKVFSHPQIHHCPEVYGEIGGETSAALLRTFFADRRGSSKCE